MRKNNFLLLLALLCGMSLFTTSCSDDNEGEQTDSRIVTEGGKIFVPDSLLTDLERYQLACQSAVIGTMRTLAGLNDVAPDVTSQTYEPAYGSSLDGDGSAVRVVKSGSTAEAELLFRSIASLDSADAQRMVIPTPDGYQLDLRNLPILPDGKTFTLGTLTFHRDGGPRRYGYVEVDIPCIPHLERIDYLSAEAFPDNGNSPYQLGDVVWVSSSSGLCSGYYVCVANNGYRSTLVHMNNDPNPGGDESINVDDDSEGCWYPYNNDHKHSTTVEDIKDYVDFMAENKDKVANIKAFIQGKAANRKPSRSGKLWHLFPDGFNNDKGVVFNLNDSKSAYIYYDAYITDDYAWVPAYYYRMAKYALVPNNCTSSDQVSCGEKKYVKDSEWRDWLGGNDYTMNVIHTSKTVSGSELEYSALKDKLELGVRAENATKNDLGKCYADDGYLYESRKQAEEYGHTPLGVVVFVNYGSEWSKNVVEPTFGGHGLVMAYGERRQTYPGWEVPEDAYSEDNGDNGYTGYIGNTHESAWNDFSGYTKTQYLDAAGMKAAESALNDWPAPPSGTSGWFIPTTAQWGAALCSDGLGKAPWPSAYDHWTSSFSGRPYETINKYIEGRDGKSTLAGRYWTSSARGAGEGVIIEMRFDDVIFKSTSAISSDVGVYLRPFFAF